jgi:hypothetical protein
MLDERWHHISDLARQYWTKGITAVVGVTFSFESFSAGCFESFVIDALDLVTTEKV